MKLTIEHLLEFCSRNHFPEKGLIRIAIPIDSFNIESIFNYDVLKTNLFFFSRPSAETKFLGIGEIDHPNIQDIITKISSGSYDSKLIDDSFSKINIPKKVPLVLGAEKFPTEKDNIKWDEFANSKWLIPQILLYNNQTTFLIILQFCGNNPPLALLGKLRDFLSEDFINEPTHNPEFEIVINDGIDNWTNIISKALKEIKNNKVEKIVLARMVELKLKNTFSVNYALMDLQNKYPDCTTFAYKESNSTFFGSTPEILFSLKDNNLETEALAGSIARGKTNEEDIHNENSLLKDPKELSEHKNVLSYLLNTFENYSEEISYNRTPQIKKLSNIQHLQTPIKVRLKTENNILEILKAVHPTPAVCGLPKKKALEFIKDLEYFDRGLYAGVIGWLNNEKQAEFVVGIRSALIEDNVLTAYAGCGIVEGSDPVTEYIETELKLKPILSLLENEIIYKP